jgi:hypothetical protein
MNNVITGMVLAVALLIVIGVYLYHEHCSSLLSTHACVW